MSTVRRFRAMGCEIEVAGAGASEQAAVEGLFALYDRTFSRFIGGSELSRVNRAAGRIVRVSTLFAETLERALSAAAQTDGLVDPTLGQALEALGYDRDFEQLKPEARPAASGRRGAWRSVRLDGRLLWAPPHVRLDLNGVVKALAVDAALARLGGDGWVSAGGDIASRGGVDVGLPHRDAVHLVSGALATSGSGRRRWRRGATEHHHLIDASTGASAGSCWQQVTACGGTCVDADVAAKAAFLLGRDGPPWLDARGIPGRFVRRDGSAVATRGWSAQLANDGVVCT